MSDLSKEFLHSPLMALVPKEGDFSDLARQAEQFESRFIEINTYFQDNNNLDEKIKKALVQERDMLEVVLKWMGK